MAKIFATFTKAEYEELCNFDYGKLYSIHTGVNYARFGDGLEIFCGVNKNGRLFISVNFYPEGHRTFNFDDLYGAIKWAKNHVGVIEEYE